MSRRPRWQPIAVAIFVTAAAAVLAAEDWPELRGKGRLGVWNETGIVETFPAGGLPVLWRTPVKAGFTGPAVSYGQLRCLRAKTGERMWETQAVTKERVRWASGLIVRHGDRLFINNDRGELIVMKPAPDGYHEISRTQLIKPTSPPGNRRELTTVNWSQPAYANRHIYARNDDEIICASLAVDGK